MQLISRTEDLAEACARLGAAAFVAVDTEFMREQTFWPKLCLIQMAADGTEVLPEKVLRQMQQSTVDTPGSALGDAVGISWLMRDIAATLTPGKPCRPCASARAWA